MIFTEELVRQLTRCPMMSPATSPAFDIACDTLRWGLAQSFNAWPCGRRQLEERFEKAWKECWLGEGGVLEDRSYEQALLAGMRMCKRLSDLVLRLQVIQPVTTFNLVIKGHIFTGEYTIVRNRRDKTKPYRILKPVKSTTIKTPPPPDFWSLACWVDARRQNPTHPEIDFYYLPLLPAARGAVYDGSGHRSFVSELGGTGMQCDPRSLLR
jgi:hypothetical protein